MKGEGNMRKIRSMPIFLIASISFFVLSNSLQAKEIKIKTENGIQVVYNPKKPAPPPGSPKSLILTEDLCIAEDEVGDFIFSEIRTIEVDDEGNIYVADSKEVCVKVFDKNGKHIRTFGKKGQGPGEIQFFTRVHMFAGKEIMIYDGGNNRLSFYSLDGEFLREISTGKYRFTRAIPDSKGNIIGQVRVFGDRSAYEIKKFDPKLNPIIEIATIELERISNVLNMVSPVVSVRLMRNDYFAWGNSQKYEIFIVNPEGKTIRKIVKDYMPVRISEAEKEKMIKRRVGSRGVPPGIKLEFPKSFHPFYYFICDDEDRIYVQTYEKDKKGDIYFDVFDAEGRYIIRFSLPEGEYPYIVKKNKMYTYIRESEEGFPIVKRYDMQWK
jgi:hypothetical protein